MNRRAFLSLLGLAAPALALDPELLLWKPGAKTILLPPVAGWPAHDLSLTWVTKEVARQFHNSLKLSAQFHRTYDREFVKGAKIGNTVRVRNTPVTLTDQLSALCPQEMTPTVITNVAESLAARAKDKGLTVFERLPHPTIGAQSVIITTPEGVSVRGIRSRDIATDGWFTRFDVLGGRG